VLEALAAAGARATFFVVGEQVRRHPELARAIVEHGHEIAVHGAAHVRYDRTRPEDAIRDVREGHDAVTAVTGAPVRWFRPPYGRCSDAALAAASELGLELVYWSAEGLDWEDTATDRIADAVGADLREGAIVLLHDSARYNIGRRSARRTAEAIPIIASRAAAQGVSLASVSQGMAAA